MSASQSSPQSIAGRGISGGMVLLFAVATGQAVACNYLAQPLLETLRTAFGASEAVAGLVVTAAQVGYAAGLVLLLPLGDLFERRGLIITLAAITVVGLVAAAGAPSMGLFIIATGVIGLTSVMAQLLVPFAATLAPEEERGRVVGNVMSGLVIGILLARTFSGVVADLSGWRSVYALAAALLVVQAVVLYLKLPRFEKSASLPYHKLLASTLSIVRGDPVLRRRALYGLLSFASFSTLWTTLAFLLSAPPYEYSDGVIGLFGLVGVAGAVTASVVGRFTDRGWVYWLTGGSSLLMLLGFVFLWPGGGSLILLLVGIVVLEVGSGGLHLSNQSEIYRRRPEERNRVNSFYMTSCFVGAAVGSTLAGLAFEHFGWAGACVLGGMISCATIARWVTDGQRPLARREPFCEADPPV